MDYGQYYFIGNVIVDLNNVHRFQEVLEENSGIRRFGPALRYMGENKAICCANI